MFVTLVILLGAIAIAVPASRYLGLGSILGYLVAGAVIGPSGFGLITNVGEIGDVSALGVTMLLFLIGLELRPHRLWVLRKAVFGMGLGQMVPTALLIAVLVHLAGAGWPSATVLGIGLALSSTAIVLPMLTERNLLPSTAGRDSFAVLLFQDMAAIPVLALVPLLAGGSVSGHAALIEFIRAVTVIAAISGRRRVFGAAFISHGGLRQIAGGIYRDRVTAGGGHRGFGGLGRAFRLAGGVHGGGFGVGF